MLDPGPWPWSLAPGPCSLAPGPLPLVPGPGPLAGGGRRAGDVGRGAARAVGGHTSFLRWVTLGPWTFDTHLIPTTMNQWQIHDEASLRDEQNSFLRWGTLGPWENQGAS